MHNPASNITPPSICAAGRGRYAHQAHPPPFPVPSKKFGRLRFYPPLGTWHFKIRRGSCSLSLNAVPCVFNIFRSNLKIEVGRERRILLVIFRAAEATSRL